MHDTDGWITSAEGCQRIAGTDGADTHRFLRDRLVKFVPRRRRDAFPNPLTAGISPTEVGR
jgi:hypothetical protein